MLAITVLLILFFLFAGSLKIFGWQKLIFETQLTFFHKYGLTRFHMLLVGMIELSASMLLITSLLLQLDMIKAIGALGIALTSLGAIYYHLKYDTIKDAIPAIVTLSLSALLLVSNSHLIHLVL